MGLFNLLFGKMIDKRISAYQSDLIQKHCDEVENMYKQMRGWRHDYHNHIQKMKAHLTLNQVNKLDEYLNELDKDLTQVDTVIKTGNVMIDAILNSKLSLIKSKNIIVNTKAIVPENLQISELDLCIIIGNLLDNAVEACENQENAFIRVFIGILKNQLYISVTNSVSHNINKKDKIYLSTKKENNHGFGLMRIDKITAKYNGFVNRQNEDGVFSTEILLPMAKSSEFRIQNSEENENGK
ncbi:MAG: GHKL domain-containing protein [Clostridia bacterium]